MNFNSKMDRRRLLQNAGLMGAGAAIAACSPAVVAQDPQNVDPDVLNFALNLEYLEAEFYLGAIGSSLSAGDTGNMAGATGTQTVTFATPAIGEMVREIAADELAHVRFLRSALGSAAVARPAIDLSPEVWTAAAKAAGVVPADAAADAFNPYANELFFLHAAFVFEDVGVTAYKGAAPLITNKTFLEAAAGILAVEAYHAGTVRTILYQNRMADTGVAGQTVQTIVGKLSDLRDIADGAGDKDQGIAPDGNVANIVPTDANGIAFSRTVSEVLNIVYLNAAASAGVSSGGFFPNGLNGTFKTS